MTPRRTFHVTATFCCLLFAASAAAQQPADLEIAQIHLGFDGFFKLGCWTQLEVVLKGGDEPYTGVVQVTTPDSDGVPTSVFTPPDHPVGVIPGEQTSARLFVRPGQENASITVRFIDDRGKERAKREFPPSPEPGEGMIRHGLPATNRMVIMFGARDALGDLFRGERGDQDANDFSATKGVRTSDPADLPLAWYGYEGVDAVLLFGSQPELYRPLVQNSERINALRRWVELGGRVVIFCGVGAPELIGPSGPLAGLAPGKFETLARLPQSTPLETFSGSDALINRGHIEDIRVPKLSHVEGHILAYAGQEPADLPLVIRERLGFGEITFVGVDPDEPPIDKWAGRTSFLRQALGWPAPATTTPNTPNYYAAQGNEDLVNAVRNALDQQFAGVKTAPFGLVALLVVGYILLIGPGDYFFVKRVLKRMEWTWITFPAIVLIVCAGAYWLAYSMKGSQLRVNQVEIVDVDLATSQARGTVWTHFFSPRVDRYDLSLEPRFGGKPVGVPDRADPGSRLVAWLGAPGSGLGGMQGQSGQTSLFDQGYDFSPQLDSIQGLPVQEWSTKTLVGRWTAKVDTPLEAELTSRPDELVAGHITNHAGLELDDCVLMHGPWAYSLPTLADGAVATIDESLQPRTVKTMLTGVAAGDDVTGQTATDGTVMFNPYTADVARQVKMMMFYEAAGGSAYASTPNRYQEFIDMSRLLGGDQAVLLARAAKTAGSQWNTGSAPLASDQDRRWVYYRFVIPLGRSRQ